MRLAVTAASDLRSDGSDGSDRVLDSERYSRRAVRTVDAE